MKVLFASVLLLANLSLFSQSSSQTLSQDELMYSFELEYLAPVELQTKSLPAGKLGVFYYQMGVEVENGDILVLVSFKPDDGNLVPHLNITTQIATVATNEENYDIYFVSPSSDATEMLGADMAAHAEFRPKKGTGRYDSGKLTSIYREGIGLIHIYYLFDEQLEIGELFRFMDIE